MAKKTRDAADGTGRLLDAWVPPPDAGDPVGCIATSFTFHPDHFEEECLSRFLRVDSGREEDGPLYVLDFEEKASQVMCAAALVDQHHCRAQRSLRWDLLPVRPPNGAIQHAKVSLLYWTNRIRVIIASANLTDDGYRRNREVFGALDFFAGSDAPRDVLRETTDFLDEVVSHTGMGAAPAVLRCRELLKRVRGRTADWGTEGVGAKDSMQLAAVFVGPRRKSLFDQVAGRWPSQHPRRHVWVVSPFFDPPEAPNRAGAGLWSLLARGKAEIHYLLEAEDLPGKQLRVRAPRSLLFVPHDRPKGTVVLDRFTEQDGEDPRPIHFKGLWLESEVWAGYLIGSSNFTSAGTGCGKPNLEANLLYLAHLDACEAGFKALDAAFPKYEPLSTDEVTHWQVPPNEDEAGEGAPIGLPAFFQAAVLDKGPEGLRIRFTFGESPPKGWRIISDEQSATATALVDAGAWEARGRPPELDVIWADARPPYGFTVFWEDVQAGSWWPLNIADGAALPPPDVLRDLPLEALLDILTSARPLREALRSWLRHQSRKVGNAQETPELDPHRRVDTNMFLLQRTRRVSWALQGLRERLRRPVATKESLAWRLHGPVGVRALACALAKEARSEAEKAFLQTEIALELVRIKPATAPGYLSVETVKNALRCLATRLATETPVPTSLPDNLRRYVTTARCEVLT